MQQEMAPDPKDPQKTRLTEQIDENLKRVYDNVLKEQVPDRFAALLAQLKDKERGN